MTNTTTRSLYDNDESSFGMLLDQYYSWMYVLIIGDTNSTIPHGSNSGSVAM